MKHLKIFEEFNQDFKQGYYRAVIKNIGETVIFNPAGYYEDITDDGIPITIGNVFKRSSTKELSGSKTVGGAVVGVWSMLNSHGQINPGTKIYIYKIFEKPYKDLSKLSMADFEYTKEVRWKKNVEGIYIGSFSYDEKFIDDAINFYNRLEPDPYDEDFLSPEKEKQWDDFYEMISNMNENDLKNK